MPLKAKLSTNIAAATPGAPPPLVDVPYPAGVVVGDAIILSYVVETVGPLVEAGVLPLGSDWINLTVDSVAPLRMFTFVKWIKPGDDLTKAQIQDPVGFAALAYVAVMTGLVPEVVQQAGGRSSVPSPLPADRDVKLNEAMYRRPTTFEVVLAAYKRNAATNLSMPGPDDNDEANNGDIFIYISTASQPGSIAPAFTIAPTGAPPDEYTSARLGFQLIPPAPLAGETNLIRLNQAGVWRQPINMFVKTGGAWAKVRQGFIKDAGVWKPFFQGQPLASGAIPIVVKKFGTTQTILNSGIATQNFTFTGIPALSIAGKRRFAVFLVSQSGSTSATFTFTVGESQAALVAPTRAIQSAIESSYGGRAGIVIHEIPASWANIVLRSVQGNTTSQDIAVTLFMFETDAAGIGTAIQQTQVTNFISGSTNVSLDLVNLRVGPCFAVYAGTQNYATVPTNIAPVDMTSQYAASVGNDLIAFQYATLDDAVNSTRYLTGSLVSYRAYAACCIPIL